MSEAASGQTLEACGPASVSYLLRGKLAFLLGRVAQLFNNSHGNISLLQVWFPDATAVGAAPPKDALQAEYHADPELALVADPSLGTFRTASCLCHDCGRLSMPGRVFRSGCVQVVQNLRVLPSCLHPRSRLQGDLADRVAEALYLPVFDLSRPEEGPLAVLEALLSTHAADSMLVANLMSFMGSQLSALQLSLSSPLPQPVKPSSLAGRRPRPPVDQLSDSDDDHDESDTWPAAPAARRPAAKQPRREAFAAPPRHPAMMGVAAAAMPASPAPAAAAPAACCGGTVAAAARCGPAAGGVAASIASCSVASADSTCTGADTASCGAFARMLPPPPPAQPAVPATTAPPELCRDEDEGCECMGPPRLKRRRCEFGSALALGVRRTQSVPRSLSDLIHEGQ